MDANSFSFACCLACSRSLVAVLWLCVCVFFFFCRVCLSSFLNMSNIWIRSAEKTQPPATYCNKFYRSELTCFQCTEKIECIYSKWMATKRATTTNKKTTRSFFLFNSITHKQIWFHNRDITSSNSITTTTTIATNTDFSITGILLSAHICQLLLSIRCWQKDYYFR